ncbi:MAG TPA: inositol monophosphatase family protein, partial [Synergistales bacterium]|nr:inositol monophosphatase family protein [Synergistales bacterium]
TRGEGAYMNGNVIETSSTEDLGNSIVGFGTSPYSKEKGIEMLGVAAHVYLNCQDLRRFGAAAIDLAYVACGRLDVFFEKDLKPWDFYAGMLIISKQGVALQIGRGFPSGDLKIRISWQPMPLFTKRCLPSLKDTPGRQL